VGDGKFSNEIAQLLSAFFISIGCYCPSLLISDPSTL
jgi:hypothetical protein